VQLGYTPIAPKGVKPWLVANADPLQGGAQFVNPLNGAVELNVVGEQFYLKSDCALAAGCVLIDPTPKVRNTPGHFAVDYIPALVTTPSVPNPNVCPPCAGATDYEQAIECADMTTSYQVLSCGGGAAQAQWDNTVNPGGLGGLSDLGTECLIHAVSPGNGKGQDTLDKTPWPLNPMQITGGAGNPPQNGYLVTTSNSIVTIPILDTTNPPNPAGGAVQIDGYLQAFIDQVHQAGNPNRQGDIEITVLNVAGCSANPGVAAPIVGGSGTSPVPVRLITGP